MSIERPTLKKVLLYPFKMFLIAHVGLAIYIAAFSAAYAFAQPRYGSLMIYRWVVDGIRPHPIVPVPISDIRPDVRQMFVRLEDYHFYTHHGVDLGAVRAAYRADVRAGRFVRGASTIDMQLARTLFLTTDKNLYRKYVEVFIAVEMDALLPKNRILSLYLNSIEWGPGVFGIGQAAHYSFGKPYTRLTEDQVRRLAAILPSPLRYTVHDFMQNPALYARYRILLDRG